MFKKIVVSLLIVCFVVSIVSIGSAEDNYVIVPTQKPFTSAESRIKDLAKKSENARMQSAAYGIGGGLLYIALGASYNSSSYSSYYDSTNYSLLYYLMGGGLVLIGASSLMFPTEIENQYLEVRKMAMGSIEEKSARETLAENGLKIGAEKAAQARQISSYAFGGVGLLYMTVSPFYGCLFLGMAAVGNIMKSDVEKAYDEYLSDKEDFIKSTQQSEKPNTQTSTPEGVFIFVPKTATGEVSGEEK